ncbi:hypothetical protein Alg215_11615, partial [Pyrenophora tritici-repentis]
KEVIMPYSQINMEMHIWAAWNSGDPNCIKRGSNAIAKDHCVKMYNEMINTFPSDDGLKSCGGSKINNCIIYGFDIERKLGVKPDGSNWRKRRGLVRA